MAKGDTINPYNYTFTGKAKVSEFSTTCYRVELRVGIRANQVWVWLRVTNTQKNNYIMGNTAKLITPSKTVYQLPYGTGSNAKVGSQRCSAAVSLGNPETPVKVTYAGVDDGNYASKTATI